METSCVGLYVHSQGAVLQKLDELHAGVVGALVAVTDRAAIERYPWFSTSFPRYPAQNRPQGNHRTPLAISREHAKDPDGLKPGGKFLPGHSLSVIADYFSERGNRKVKVLPSPN